MITPDNKSPNPFDATTQPDTAKIEQKTEKKISPKDEKTKKTGTIANNVFPNVNDNNKVNNNNNVGTNGLINQWYDAANDHASDRLQMYGMIEEPIGGSERKAVSEEEFPLSDKQVELLKNWVENTLNKNITPKKTECDKFNELFQQMNEIKAMLDSNPGMPQG